MINNQHFKSLPPNPSGVTMADRSTIRLICFKALQRIVGAFFADFRLLVCCYNRNTKTQKTTQFFTNFLHSSKKFFTHDKTTNN